MRTVDDPSLSMVQDPTISVSLLREQDPNYETTEVMARIG